MKSFSKWDIILFVLCGLYAVFFAQFLVQSIFGIKGLQLATGNPAGGDFINLYTAGKMTLAGQAEQIYLPQAFQQAQSELISEQIGLRLWAYPPHSLFLAAPFALLPYFTSLALWSALGLAALYFGARALNISSPYAIVLCLNPAALLCVYFGQTGNLATGLLMLALAPLIGVPNQSQQRRAGFWASALTIKPQFGPALPLLLALQKRWLAFGIAVGCTFILVAASLVIFEIGPWVNYFGDTAPLLAELELNGSGAFMNMIPSFFMALRLLGIDGASAMFWHFVIVLPIIGLAIFVILFTKTYKKRIAVALLATAILTPYLHVYDMSIIVAAALVFALTKNNSLSSAAQFLLVLAGWVLPHFLYDLNANSVPIAPLILVAILGVVCFKKGPENRPS